MTLWFWKNTRLQDGLMFALSTTGRDYRQLLNVSITETLIAIPLLTAAG